MPRLLGGTAAVLLALVVGVSSSGARSADACGVPATAPVWIDYGEGPVPPDVRAVFARPGVVVSTSGTAVPADFRAKGAATTYFVLHLPNLVGQPSAPADPASIPAAAAKLLAQAQASTACPTPWIALNELLGSNAVLPWSPTTAQYRADVLALMQQLAAGGARPFLLVHGNPVVGGAAADWWRQVAQVGDVVYEAYYDATNISRLGPLLGSRRMRLGMRSVIALFESVAVPPGRLGVMLGFHVAPTPGAGGRQGLQPREAWLGVVKWEALAARQVVQDTGIATVWSWGWGTFGPESVDSDKPAAACVYLWTRDPALCDGVSAGGPGFDTSLVAGQIALPATVYCTFTGGQILTTNVDRLARYTRNRHAALTALFARAVLRTAAPVTLAQIVAVERTAVARTFHGKRPAYLRALARRHATLGIAREIIRDELRRRAIAAMLAQSGNAETTLQWVDDDEAKAADTATCRRDDLPGGGDFPRSDARDVGVVPLLTPLRFLLADRTPPAAPAAPIATAAPGAVSLGWSYGAEPDLAGYEVLRGAASGGPYTKLTKVLHSRPAFVDMHAPAGTPSFYVVRAVDTSGNESPPSAEVSAAPG
jgi:hypothetical protein